MSLGFKLAAATLAACVLQSAPAVAQQDWPNKPVKILIGFGAGGGTDVATRIVAEGLSEVLGQQFVVENRPGAGGTIAGGIVARAPKDGYTMAALSTGHSVSAVLVKAVPYDPVKDFALVGVFGLSAYVVVVGKNSPATDLKSLVEHVNKQDGKLNYSSTGLGGTPHLIAEDLRLRTGMKAQHVPYKTTGEVVSALMRGDAAYAVELYHALRGQIESGDLRAIATAAPGRWPAIPSVPALSESIPGFAVLGWYGFAFPAGTPQPIIDKIRDALGKVLARADVRKRLEGLGAAATLTTPDDFRKTIENDIKGFQEVARKSGIEAK
jgi:tripartite-type tricarboxylate transporter receptor subunit TctC